MSCGTILSGGIPRDCPTVNGAVGVEKDLILVNFEEYDQIQTLAAANFEADDTNNNQDGLTTIFLKSGATQHVFEGTDYSVKPTVTGEVREDGNSWYSHSIGFIVYSKTSTARKTLIELGNSTVVAIMVDRSTGFKEIFGAEHGLKVSDLTREYLGNQNANFYPVTLVTPDVAGVKESNLGYLALDVTVAA